MTPEERRHRAERAMRRMNTPGCERPRPASNDSYGYDGPPLTLFEVVIGGLVAVFVGVLSVFGSWGS